MRKGMIACLAFALCSSAVSVKLWLALRHEREVNAGLVAQLAGAPVAAGAAAGTAVARGMGTSPSLAAASAAPSVAAFTPSSPEDAEEAERNFLARRRAQLEDPEYRGNFLSNARLRLALSNPGLPEALKLTPDEATRLYDILAERELDMEGVELRVAGLPEEREREAREDAIDDINRKRDDAMAALLGDARLAQYDDYRKEQTGIRQVAELNMLFNGSGVPLSAEQSKKVATMLSDQQAWLAAQVAGLTRGSGSRDPVAMAQTMDRAIALMAEGNRRKVEAARPLLNDRQLQLMKDSLDQALLKARAAASEARSSAAAPGR